MASPRVAAALSLSSWLALASISSATSCAKSDAIDPTTSAVASAGGSDAAGPGTGGAGPAGPTSGSDSTSSAEEAASSGTPTTTAAGSAGGDPGSGGASGGTGVGSTSSGGTCGDGVAEGDEACDGDDLRGDTCASVGFAGGALACDADCALDTQGCSDVAACANGLDDDDDGLFDDEDPGCTSDDDADELVFSDTCEGAGTPVVDLTTVPGLTVDYVGTTSGAMIVNNFTATAGGACPATPGPEVAFHFVVSEEIGTLVVSLDNPGTSSDWDPVVYVRSGSCTGAQIGCNNDAGGLASVLVLSDVQPGEYYVFIDGHGAGDAGDFELTLTPS